MSLLPARPAGWSLLAAIAVGGCAGYEPPQPGQYAGIGTIKSDLTCVYEAPTGNLVSAWRCRRSEELPDEAAKARDLLERTRVAPVSEAGLLRP